MRLLMTVGYLTSNPKVQNDGNNTEYINFQIKKDGIDTLIEVQVWKDELKKMSLRLKKGMMVNVVGELYERIEMSCPKLDNIRILKATEITIQIPPKYTTNALRDY